jgi:solute carrier family 35 protein F1/2
MSISSMDRKQQRSINDYFVDEPDTEQPQQERDDGSMGTFLAANTLTSITKDGIMAQQQTKTSHYKVLLFGQFISLTMASLWATQSTLFLRCSLSAPSFSNIWVYAILSTNAIPLYRQGQRIKADNTLPDPPYWILRRTLPLHLSPWVYFFTAFVAVEANYIMMLALRYTTLTSVALFDALAIPSAMVMSAAILNRKYRLAHLLGASMCLLGMAINVVTDYVSSSMAHHAMAAGVEIKDTTTTTTFAQQQQHGRGDGSMHYPHKILGDALAICGGTLYGINDVIAEICVRQYGGVHEYLTMLALWGMVITIIQSAILEREAVAAFFHDGGCSVQASLSLLAAYVICQAIRKTSLCHFLLVSEAALLNLSMLTSDLYTAIFSIVIQEIMPRQFFYLGLVMVVSGIFIYEMTPSPATTVSMK